MKKTNLLFGFCLLLFFSCKKNQTPNIPFKTVENEKSAILDTLFNDLYNDGAFNGNVLVAESGEIIYQNSFGEANLATHEALHLGSVFELASVSKTFTAMGIVQLHKEGKLNYDDLLSDYIPELSHYTGISIKHLLTHTGGLPDYMKLAEEHWDKTKFMTNTDAIKLLEALQPEVRFEPNQRWEYSNTGYLLLATIIERISGKSFSSYLEEKIFAPLHMTNSFVYRSKFEPKQVSDYAMGYVYSDSLKKMILAETKDLRYVYLDGVFGDGMVHSNVYDLLKWDRALYSEDFLTQEDKDLIFSSYTTQEGETNYGFGWFVSQSETNGKEAFHSGSWGGYITYLGRYLDSDKTLIVLQNYSSPFTESPLSEIVKVLQEEPILRRFKLPEETLKKYAGTYLAHGVEMEVSLENGRLWIPINPQVNLFLVPKTETSFVVKGFKPEVTYEFIIDENAEVQGYRAQQIERGIDFTGERIK